MGEFTEIEPVKAPVPDAGRPKLNDDEKTQLHDSLQVINNRFSTIADQTQQYLSELKSQIESRDEQHWVIELLVTALEVAVTAGTSAVGAQLIHAFQKAISDSEPVKELIKVTTAEAGKAAILKAKPLIFGSAVGAGAGIPEQSLVNTFISSQKDAARYAQMLHWDDWVHTYQHEIKTPSEAGKLEKSLDSTAIQAIAMQYVSMARDAWVTLQAQREFGTKSTYGAVPTTDMSDDAERKVEQSLGGSKGKAPHAFDAASGGSPGVLTIRAWLPDVVHRPDEVGEIDFAVLNAVNSSIRSAYENKRLSEIRVPRQIVADVPHGDLPGFSVNLDEESNPSWIKSDEWLRAKAKVLRSKGEASGSEDVDIGLRGLLRELIVTKIHGT